jgi:hypothetical protein
VRATKAPRDGGNVTQKRMARGPKVKTAQPDDRSAALAVLESKGVAPDDPRIAELGWSYLDVASDDEQMAAAEELVHADFRRVMEAVERVAVKTIMGKRLSEGLFREVRSLYDDGRCPTIGELEGFLRGLNHLRIREEWKPLARRPGKCKRGRPTDRSVEITTYNAGLMHGWGWQVCAAALFVFTQDFNLLAGERVRWNAAHPKARPLPIVHKYSYATIKKRFQDWDRRHRRSGTVNT